MDTWRHLRHLRWAGVGGTGRGHAGVGRIVSLPERKLWAERRRAADFVSVYLAAFFQRAPVDRLRRNRAGRLCGLFVARPGSAVCGPQLESCGAGAGHPASGMAGFRRDFPRDRHRRAGDGSALPQDHQHRVDVEGAAGRRGRHHDLDHRCRPDAFQREAGL